MLRNSITIVWSYIILLDFIWSSISYVEMRVNIGLRFCWYLCWVYRAKAPSRCPFISGYFEHVASDPQHMILERRIISTFLASFYLFFFFLLLYPWPCPPLRVFSVAQSCLILLSPPRTVAHQARLSMGFPRQEYGVGSHFLSRGFPLPRNQSPVSCIPGRFFTTEPHGKPPYPLISICNSG